MRIVLVIVLVVVATAFANAQDGSNIRYLKPNELNDSHLGKYAHLDFGTRSFAFADYEGEKRPLSTIEIKLNGKAQLFREHRVDDGYNNWFKKQYLESVEKVNNFWLRLVKSEILKIDKDSIRVKGYFEFFDKQGNRVEEKSFSEELEFKKSELSEVLIEAN
jgi:hypothetical protein